MTPWTRSYSKTKKHFERCKNFSESAALLLGTLLLSVACRIVTMDILCHH